MPPTRLGLEDLEAWDLAYVSEKLRADRYAFSDQEVKQYLPETSVLPGMFKLVENLYGITIDPAMRRASSSGIRMSNFSI